MKKIKYIIPISIFAVALLIVGIPTAKANRSYFVPTVQTSAASTSPQFIGVTTNAGTSTLPVDSYTYDPSAIGSASLLVQSTASTSASVQKLFFQYSQDGIDWFSDVTATSTTLNYSILDNTSGKYFTINGNSSASTTRFILSVPTPTRFVRAVVNATTASSSIWMQWIPTRQLK